MKIEILQKEHIQECAELFSATFSSSPWNEPWNSSLAFERLNHFFESKGFFGLIISEGTTILGFTLGNSEPFYFGSIFYLREMCVCPSKQNTGIGKKLLTQLEQQLKTLHIQHIYLTTNKNILAASFYQNNGFSIDPNMGFYAKTICV